MVKGNSFALGDGLPDTGLKLVVHGISMEISMMDPAESVKFDGHTPFTL